MQFKGQIDLMPIPVCPCQKCRHWAMKAGLAMFGRCQHALALYASYRARGLHGRN